MARAVALLLLCAVVCAQAAPYRPQLRDVLSRGRKGASVATAANPAKPSYQEEYSSGEDYGVETKEICLQETEQKVCEYSTGDLDIYFWTSDFSCCQEDHYGYDARPVGDMRNTQLWGSQASIGSCDWTINYADYPSITNNVDKMGTAWATCWFGPEAEICGGPLCDRMVMSLQGSAYFVYNVYTYWGEAATDGNCDSIYATPAPRTDGTERNAATNGTAPATADARDARRAARADRLAATTAPGGKTRRGAGSRIAKRQSKPAGRASPGRTPQAQVQYSHDGQDNRDVFYGEATIIMGIVTAMAGQRKEKWDEGVFEYVPYYLYDNVETEGIDASYPWIRDKTYKFTFYKHSSKY